MHLEARREGERLVRSRVARESSSRAEEEREVAWVVREGRGRAVGRLHALVW